MRVRILVMAYLCCCLLAWGQELGTTTLNGEVTDQQGLVIANATVTAKSTATGVERSTTTNRSGSFFINGLTPGGFLLEVSAKGFAPQKSKVHLAVGQQADLRLQMKVQQEQTAITVDDEIGPGVN